MDGVIGRPQRRHRPVRIAGVAGEDLAQQTGQCNGNSFFAQLLIAPFGPFFGTGGQEHLAGGVGEDDRPHVGSFELDGHTIATYTWGDPTRQPYVLFAHGWSSHGTRFLPWVPRLREQGYAVVAFDQPAHGRSSGTTTNLPDFAATLLAVGEYFGPAALLVAHSLGGAAASVAMAHGLQAERVVLIAPAADPVAATERFAQLIRLPQRLFRALICSFERQVGTTFDALQAHRNAPCIARPALIVHDVEDREVPWSEGERYARYWPDSHLLSTQGLGHNRIAGDDTVIAAALRFLHAR